MRRQGREGLLDLIPLLLSIEAFALNIRPNSVLSSRRGRKAFNSLWRLQRGYKE